MVRRPLLLAGLLIFGGVVIGFVGGMFAVREPRPTAIAPVPEPAKRTSPKPSPLANEFDFKGLLHKLLDPIRDTRFIINQNRDRRDEIGRSQVTCMAICISKAGHEKHVFEKLPNAVKAEMEAKGAKVDFLPGGIAYDMAKFWTGEFSIRHEGESYSGTARIWCIADGDVPNLGQRFTVIVTIDETGPEPG